MKKLVVVAALMLWVSGNAAAQPVDTPVSVGEVRTLSAHTLAIRILGPYVGSHVIEIERHEYDDGSHFRIPESVDFYTQPTLTYPRINGICATDVITVTFDWFAHQDVTSLTPLPLDRIEAKSLFKAFGMPPGEPGSPENERLQAAECAHFSTARDAFSAPSAGDAQWLVAMEREYSSLRTVGHPIRFRCQDFEDSTCALARNHLSNLKLNTASIVASIDCPPLKSRDQVNFCYRLIFSYAGTIDPEWEMTLVGGMADGFAPQQIRSMKLKHLRRPVVVY